jgi:hypothetical protein
MFASASILRLARPLEGEHQGASAIARRRLQAACFVKVCLRSMQGNVFGSIRSIAM